MEKIAPMGSKGVVDETKTWMCFQNKADAFIRGTTTIGNSQRKGANVVA